MAFDNKTPSYKLWIRLPNKFKLRWWRETDYGRVEPTSELVEERRRLEAEVTNG